MATTATRQVPSAFLSSRISPMKDLRGQIHVLGQKLGKPVWVSEIDSGEEFATLDEQTKREQITIACLRKVREAPLFLCVLDGSYGGTADWQGNAGQTSVLELEIATAAFSKRDIWIFLRRGERDRRLNGLLAIVRLCCPRERIVETSDDEDLLDTVSRILDPTKSSAALRTGRMVQELSRERSPLLTNDLYLRDVQFAGGVFEPLQQAKPDPSLVRTLIADAEREIVEPVKLARLWIAVRHLSAVPYLDASGSRTQFPEYAHLWDQTLQLWSGAAAWYGLHGHFLLGRLAALNSLAVLRHAAADTGFGTRSSTNGTHIADAGAMASEYYSISKIVPSFAHRMLLLSKALWHCNLGLRERVGSDMTGLLDIRGHVKMRMFNLPGGLSDLKAALRLRLDANATEAQIGESEAHLGAAYLKCKMYRKAERLLEEGVAKLRPSESHRFAAQALRHLAELYFIQGQRDRAIVTLLEARSQVEPLESEGQISQIDDLLRKFGYDGM